MTQRDRRHPSPALDTPSETSGETRTDGPSAAFEALYDGHAGPLTQQVFLLTGRARLARRAVERAFQTAWQRWPEVAVDADPVGWVRAAAHDYALAPWRRLRLRAAERPRPETPAPPPDAPVDRALLEAVLALPAPYRRTLLLHDGLGLGLAETAAEVEASTPAATGRLTHARECIAERLPELGLDGLPPGRQGEVLHARLTALAASRPVAPPAARTVRESSERRTRRTTRAGFGVTGLLALTAVTVAITTPGGHAPPPERSVAASPSREVRQAAPERRAAPHRRTAPRAQHRGARLTPDFLR
ncbi:hypothetical protein GCM10010211_56500 [Streptomyces albospinus]|uniref:Uncharacterized protein n=1 Tax=Streptomyces albospinus TaxID=285515 RepID=A0ABQ2VGS1_9ACTN|nr:hypothetical protein [Streptomyces albospinus]GGU83218.1 hypothetical protein GCM10010211_56500 [Streptomyces albospinus]